MTGIVIMIGMLIGVLAFAGVMAVMAVLIHITEKRMIKEIEERHNVGSRRN